jgi:hypothetical protein
MNEPQMNERTARSRRPATEFPPLLNVLRDASLYPLLRALLNNEISKLLTSMYFTYPLDGDEVLLDCDRLKTVVGSIGRTIGNQRLRATAKRLRGLEGQVTYVLSPAAKQALLLEMAALLGNLSAADLQGLPPVDAFPDGEAQ